MTPHAVGWIYICAPSRIPLRKARVSGATLPKASLAVSMVNFHDYSVIAQDTRAYDTVFRLSLARLKFYSNPPLTVVAAKLWHTMGGFYM